MPRQVTATAAHQWALGNAWEHASKFCHSLRSQRVSLLPHHSAPNPPLCPPLAAAPPAPTGQPGQPNIDQLTNQLEYSFIDIPDLISLSDEELEQLPPAERQQRRAEKQRREAAARQAALQVRPG